MPCCCYLLHHTALLHNAQGKLEIRTAAHAQGKLNIRTAAHAQGKLEIRTAAQCTGQAGNKNWPAPQTPFEHALLCVACNSLHTKQMYKNPSRTLPCLS
jgi:hypothetical protein